MKKTTSHNKGFTLIETLVALSIFSLSIVALIVAAGQGVSNFQTIKARLTASYLAQEGVELVHNIRDTEMETGNWASFVNPSSSPIANCIVPNPNSVGCTIDAIFNPSLINVSQCNPSSCPRLKYSEPIGYNYTSPDTTIFERIISVELIGTNEAKVTSTVKYQIGGNTSQITMSEMLTNWIGNVSSSSANPAPVLPSPFQIVQPSNQPSGIAQPGVFLPPSNSGPSKP